MLIKTFPPQAVLLQLSKCMILFKTEYFFFLREEKRRTTLIQSQKIVYRESKKY